MRRVSALLGMSAALVVVWLSLFPAHALATVDGPCTASIDNVDVTDGHASSGEAVPVRSGTEVPVAGTARSRVTDLSYTVHIAGGGVQVGRVVIAQDGTSWSGAVDLSSISNATVGLFQVTLDVETTGAPCTGTAYVCIEGRSPFTTVAGAAAAVIGLGGAIVLVLSLTGARRMSLARSSLQGFAGGATAGLGAAVLLQQFCTLPLSASTAIGVPLVIGGAAALGAAVLRGAGGGGGGGVAQPQQGRPAGAPTEPVGAPTRPVGVVGPSPTIEWGGGGPAPAPPVFLPPPPPGGVDVGPPVATDQERTCPTCGTANETDALFCTNCGDRLP